MVYYTPLKLKLPNEKEGSHELATEDLLIVDDAEGEGVLVL